MVDKIAETANDSAQWAVASLSGSKPFNLEAKIAADMATLAIQVKQSNKSQVKTE